MSKGRRKEMTRLIKSWEMFVLIYVVTAIVAIEKSPYLNPIILVLIGSPIRFFLSPLTWVQIIGLIVIFPGIVFVASGILLALYFYRSETTFWGKKFFPLMIFLQVCILGTFFVEVTVL
jgi:hypothetical protein